MSCCGAPLGLVWELGPVSLVIVFDSDIVLGFSGLLCAATSLPQPYLMWLVAAALAFTNGTRPHPRGADDHIPRPISSRQDTNYFFRSRRDGRSTNGTLTFRRASTTPLGQPSSQPPAPIDHAVQPSSATETSIAQLATYDLGPTKYTREDLLGVYRTQKGNDDASRLFIPGWNPGHVNGNAARGWGKPNDNHIPQEPGACWDDAGDTTPMGLQDLSVQEKEVRPTPDHLHTVEFVHGP